MEGSRVCACLDQTDGARTAKRDGKSLAMNAPITHYRDFWPYYLREHAKPGTRALHYVGTGLATATLLGGFASRRWWLVALALLAGYGPAWIAHFFVEKNRPATLTYPLWSLVSDYRMAWSWLTGRLPRELAKADVHHNDKWSLKSDCHSRGSGNPEP